MQGVGTVFTPKSTKVSPLKKGMIFMNIKITGKDLKATDAIKDYVEKKVEKLVKYFG